MTREPDPITLFEVAKRAVDVCDPDGTDGELGDYLLQFEDADEPITVVQNLAERTGLAAARADTDLDNPGVAMAGAVILYLAHRRDQVNNDPDEVLRLAARAEWSGQPPAAVQDWLAMRGVDV